MYKICIGYLFALAAVCTAAELPELIQRLGSEDFNQQHAARVEMQALMANASKPGADAARRMDLENQLLEAQAALTNNLASRLWTIRMLEWFGSEGVAARLAHLLEDAEPKVREAASRALAANPSPAAGKALLKALKKAPLQEQAGLIDTLAYHGDTKAASNIAKFLSAEDERVVEAAAVALGKLGQKKALKKLAAAGEGAPDSLRPILEAAELQIGVDPKRAEALISGGSRTSIRVDAFRQLANEKPEQAAEVLSQFLEGEGNPARQEILRAVMASEHAALKDRLVNLLPELHESAQLVIVGAISDRALAAYEGSLLSMLESSGGAFRAELIRTLGVIGTDKSFNPLYGLFMNQSTPELVTALARLNVPEADGRLMNAMDNEADEQKRIATIRLLALRMPQGALEKLNAQVAAAQPEAVRKAAFKELETAGNLDTARLMAELIATGDPLKKSAQQSLKRLSTNLQAPDLLWDRVYGPVMEQASSDAVREDLLAILDGAAGSKSLNYLKGLVMDPAHPLHDAGIRSLGRWPNADAGGVWLELMKKEAPGPEDLEAAVKGLARCIGEQNPDLAVQAIRAAPTAELKQKLVKGCRMPTKGRWKNLYTKAFTPLLNDPDIGIEVHILLGKTPPSAPSSK